MSSNKQAVGEPSRSRVSGLEAYEVEHFARTYGISAERARGLIVEIADYLAALDAATERLKCT